jgi:hypothetical protein
MKTNPKTTRKNSFIPLPKLAKVIPLYGNHIRYQKEMKQFIAGIWHVASITLWPTRAFSDSETEKCKELIAEHFYNGKNHKQNFLDLIERICLVKRYLSRNHHRYVAKPEDWLNIHFRNGLSGTAKWLESVKEQRKTVPTYNEGILSFSKALLNFIVNPDWFSYPSCKQELFEKKQFDLLQILNNTIINFQYGE